jgi:hypothetical protein
VARVGSDSKCTQNFWVNDFLRKRKNYELWGGATCVCGDKNKMGLKWDVRSWAEFNWAKTWPLVKNLMNSWFSIRKEIIHLLDVLTSYKILVAMLSGQWPLQ